MLSLMLISVVVRLTDVHTTHAADGLHPAGGRRQTPPSGWQRPEYADGSPAVYSGRSFPTWRIDFADNDPMGLVPMPPPGRAWTNELGGTSVGSVSGVAVADGRVYLGGTDGRLCIDEETGRCSGQATDRRHRLFWALIIASHLKNGLRPLSSVGVLHAFTPEGMSHGLSPPVEPSATSPHLRPEAGNFRRRKRKRSFFIDTHPPPHGRRPRPL